MNQHNDSKIWPSLVAGYSLALAFGFSSYGFCDDWAQWRGAGGRGVWDETGVLEEFSTEQMPLVWSVSLGSGYSGPTVAKGRVYVTDRVVDPEQVERVHCLDWKNGQTIWSHGYPCAYEDVGYLAGPRAAVTVVDGFALSLGTMGDLICFDAESGSVRWHHRLNVTHKIRMPIWGIAASPVAYGGLVIVQIGGEDACLVAFNIKTGEEVWRALGDNASYSTPIVIEQGGQDVLLCWTGDNIVGVGPTTGEVYWSIPHPPTAMVINVPTPVVHGDRAFFSGFYDGSTLIQLGQTEPSAEMLWHRQGASEKETDALHCMISTPIFASDFIYGVDSYGELRCLEASTGDRIWEDLTATRTERWSNIHMVRNAGKVWMFNEEGYLIIGRLTPVGFEEQSRTHLIDPTEEQLRQRGGVCWAHPAYAYKHVFARNDRELVCADLSAQP